MKGLLAHSRWNLIILLAVLGLQCVTYRNFPEQQVGKQPAKQQYVLANYKITGGTVFGGLESLRKVFKGKSPFPRTEKVDADPREGLFIDVKIEQVIPSGGALLFGYCSASTLLVVPVWSTQDGYNVQYIVNRDGRRIRSYEYEIRRKAFVWLFIMPFAWVNFFTYSEADAFEATAYQFFHDAREHFTEAR